MTKRVLIVAVVAMLVVAMGAMSAMAAKYRPERTVDPRIKTHLDYAFKRGMMPAESEAVTGTDRTATPQSSLGVTDTRISDSPGSVIGFTYYTVQKNASIHRRIATRGGAQVHMTWTFGQNLGSATRSQAYNFYDPNTGVLGAGGNTDPTASRSGFGSLDAAPYSAASSGFDTRAVAAGHYTKSTGDPNVDGTRAQANYSDPDTDPNTFNFSRITEDLDIGTTGEPIWPIVEFHDVGGNQWTYLVMMGDNFGADPEPPTDALVFYRKAGTGASGTWEGTQLDTVAFQSYSIASSPISGKVCVSYLQYQGPTTNDTPGWRADIVYKENTNYGATADWPATYTNVTNFPPPPPAPDSIFGYPRLETTCLYDSNDNLHIMWNSGIFEPPTTYYFSSRIYHWADHTDELTVVTEHFWTDEGPNCGNAGNTLSTGNKLSVGECDGNLYAVWAQANDVEGGVFDDCANTEAVGDINLTGNHELWLSVSTDLDGGAWDARRNLTNTYNPDCALSATPNRGECNNDIHATVARYGQDLSDVGAVIDSFPTDAIVEVDPGYAGDNYLDITYVNDEIPGIFVYDDGSPETRNNVKWFRIPCVDPVVEARIKLSQSSIGFPNYVNHGDDTTFFVTIENQGNLDLQFT
ncbi:hypothetical protein GF420_08330, partial [candidate division GN15 bacterium]|nr:hypothetical protein [candidate division GN15 bacterium]